MQTCTLAVDIGASSGRHIAGTVQNGKTHPAGGLPLRKRRPTARTATSAGTSTPSAKEVVNGLKAAHDAGFGPRDHRHRHLGRRILCCWMRTIAHRRRRRLPRRAHRGHPRGAGKGIRPDLCRPLRPHRHPVPAVQHGLPADGAQKREHPEQLAAAKTFLMVPDYLNYLLCGVPANEYTNASTTALVGADSRDWDDALIENAGSAARHLPAHQDRREPCWGTSDAGNSEGCRFWTPRSFCPRPTSTGSAFLAVARAG